MSATGSGPIFHPVTHVLVRCEYDDGSGIDPTLVEFAVDREDARQVHAEIHSLVLAEERFQLRVPGEPTSVP